MDTNTAPKSLQRDYALSRNRHEYERLMRQSRLLRPMCRRMLEDMGLKPGMHVLDLGCGPGDLSLLAAELVGPDGSVLGIDHDAGALAVARERARDQGLDQIRFAQSDINQLPTMPNVDAVIGRYVLLYQTDPAATLAHAAKRLQPGGIIGFMEPWFRPMERTEGAFGQTIHFIYETMRANGAIMSMGARLHRTFIEAGLPVPTMRYEMLMDASPDTEIPAYLRDTLESVLPAAQAAGLMNGSNIDLDTLPGEIKADVDRLGIPMIAAPTVAAWCKHP